MASAALLDRAKLENWSDEEVVKRVLAGDTALYELLMRDTTSASIAWPGPSCEMTPKPKT